MSKYQRDKGKRCEQEVVTILKAAGFDTAKRTGEYVANDILCAIDGRDRIIEVKVRANGFSSLYTFLKDSWACVHKADRKPYLITMELQDFLALVAPEPAFKDMEAPKEEIENPDVFRPLRGAA